MTQPKTERRRCPHGVDTVLQYCWDCESPRDDLLRDRAWRVPSSMFGQCACGATLTAWHLELCPLRPQQAQTDAEKRALTALVQAAAEARYDTTHVAVPGEN